MAKFIMQRMSASLVTVVLLVALTGLFRSLIPGDVVTLIMAEARDPQAEIELREKLGLNDPPIFSVANYALDALQGDLGVSLWSGRAVSTLIAEALPVTIELAIIAIVISMLVAIPIGIISAVSRDTPVDYIARTLAIAGLTVPSFVIGTLVITIPALIWGWSPPFRYTPFTDDAWANLQQMWIPAIVSGVLLAASSMRITRTMLLEVLYQDYIRTARAKGLSMPRVILRHALPNALIPVVAHSALQIAFLLGGSAIIEQLFGLPGMGRLLIDAIGIRDYPLVQGIILLSGVVVVVVNLSADLFAAFLDPRIRYE